MKTLYLDCFCGISGNMFIGMLIQAGMPFDEFKQAMTALNLEGYSLTCESVSKMGIQSVYYNVLLDSEKHHHHEDHTHDVHEHAVDTAGYHHHHEHRGLSEITKIIEASPYKEEIKKKSLQVFQNLAQAEATVHGVPVDKIHFHEVGAIDCILDIVGTIWALDYLGIEQVASSALHVGSGFVKCAHGVMPVPAPATAELLTGIPYYDTDVWGELVTPTGAALVKTLASYIGPRPDTFIHDCVAYGAGTKDLEIPNVVRGFIGQANAW